MAETNFEVAGTALNSNWTKEIKHFYSSSTDGENVTVDSLEKAKEIIISALDSSWNTINVVLSMPMHYFRANGNASQYNFVNHEGRKYIIVRYVNDTTIYMANPERSDSAYFIDFAVLY